jgi:hypothetical protein
MANQTRTTGLPCFFADQTSAEGLRRELTDGPMAAARQDAICSALDLFSVLGALPAAFMDSQERELKRLESSGKERSPRIDALRASIEQVRELRRTADLGQARIARSLVALSSSDDLVHGFVSDATLAPMPGLTVRLTLCTEKEGDGKSLSAISDTDGYYSISLGTSPSSDSKPPTPATPGKLSDRMAELLANVNAKAQADAKTDPSGATTTQASDNSSELLARIDVLDPKGALLHRDPMPLVLNHGSAYREYVIVDGFAANRDDFKGFVRERGSSDGVAGAETAASNTGTEKKVPPAQTKKAAASKPSAASSQPAGKPRKPGKPGKQK